MPIITRSSRLRIALLLLFSGGCRGDAPPGPDAVQRYDSAGIEIVVNPGEDRVLDWSFDEVVRIGGVGEAQVQLTSLGLRTLTTDGRDRIYAFDQQAREVHAFDRDGMHLWTAGRLGSGPGEFELASSLTASPDGRIVAFDTRASRATTFDREGALVETVPLREVRSLLAAGWVARDDGRFVGLWTEQGLEEPFERALALWVPPDPDSIVPIVRGKPLRFAAGIEVCAGFEVGHPPDPYLTPEDRWAAADTEIAWRGAWPEYRVDLYEDTRLVRSVRRAILPRAVSEEEVREAYGAEQEVRVPGTTPSCVYTRARVLEVRGWSEVAPTIDVVSIAPTGELWVRRFALGDDPGPVDLFRPDGRYLGSLSSETPFPHAFLSGDRFVTLERDSLDVPVIVIHQIRRGDAVR